ncbi:extracellular solute-binding protein [uncultured Metabacillus sp.]|uniref:extracellular solute-binding protein n=1 Tax=uncultured Metabacillus sp. TaxID=2860135 RepID=UPI00261767C3|nr:extracellular solute-binding protein [uncultured Metabacillus sp.]
MKKLILLVLVLVLSVSLVACNSIQSNTNDKIVIWTQAAADHPEGKMFAKRVEQYNKENPDKPQVVIENITRAGAGSGYIDKLNAAITANDMPDIFTLDGPDVAAYVHSGKTALAIAGFWYVNEIVNNYPNLKFKTVRYPKMNENYDGLYTPSGSWAFVRNGQIEDKERLKQVVEVMEYLTNDEAAEEYYQADGSIPGRMNTIDVIDTNTDNEYYNEAWTVLKYQVENTNRARPISPGYPYLSKSFAKDVLLKIVQNKTTDAETIKQYLDDATEKIDKEFEKYRK